MPKECRHRAGSGRSNAAPLPELGQCMRRHRGRGDGRSASDILWAKIRAIWAKSDLDDEFNAELDAHLDLLTAEYEKVGNDAAGKRGGRRFTSGRA